MKPKKYDSATAFRRALEDRLKEIARGDPLLEPLEKMEGKDWLHFAGIPRTSLRAISPEQHFAEKIHAYTLPRQNPNSRVRDLVDMVLLIQSEKLVKYRTADAIRVTFQRRNTHPRPEVLAAPPKEWAKPYAAMAKECKLSEDMDHAFATVKSFLDGLQNE